MQLLRLITNLNEEVIIVYNFHCAHCKHSYATICSKPSSNRHVCQTYFSSVSGNRKITAKVPITHTNEFNKYGGEYGNCVKKDFTAPSDKRIVRKKITSISMHNMYAWSINTTISTELHI